MNKAPFTKEINVTTGYKVVEKDGNCYFSFHKPKTPFVMGHWTDCDLHGKSLEPSVRGFHFCEFLVDSMDYMKRAENGKYVKVETKKPCYKQIYDVDEIVCVSIRLIKELETSEIVDILKKEKELLERKSRELKKIYFGKRKKYRMKIKKIDEYLQNEI